MTWAAALLHKDREQSCSIKLARHAQRTITFKSFTGRQRRTVHSAKQTWVQRQVPTSPGRARLRNRPWQGGRSDRLARPDLPAGRVGNRRRGGFRRTAAIAQRSARRDDFEAALVRGATPIRFTGLIVIGADTLDDLNTRTASAQVAAQRAGCSLSILRGVQREAMAAIGQPLRGSR